MTYNHNDRYEDCRPVTLCGRKVWISERGGYGGTLKEIWVHLSPWQPAVVYLKGSSLTDGDEASNWTYLEDCCRAEIERARPMSKKLEQIWYAEHDWPKVGKPGGPHA